MIDRGVRYNRNDCSGGNRGCYQATWRGGLIARVSSRRYPVGDGVLAHAWLKFAQRDAVRIKIAFSSVQFEIFDRKPTDNGLL